MKVKENISAVFKKVYETLPNEKLSGAAGKKLEQRTVNRIIELLKTAERAILDSVDSDTQEGEKRKVANNVFIKTEGTQDEVKTFVTNKLSQFGKGGSKYSVEQIPSKVQKGGGGIPRKGAPKNTHKVSFPPRRLDAVDKGDNKSVSIASSFFAEVIKKAEPQFSVARELPSFVLSHKKKLEDIAHKIRVEGKAKKKKIQSKVVFNGSMLVLKIRERDSGETSPPPWKSISENKQLISADLWGAFEKISPDYCVNSTLEDYLKN